MAVLFVWQTSLSGGIITLIILSYLIFFDHLAQLAIVFLRSSLSGIHLGLLVVFIWWPLSSCPPSFSVNHLSLAAILL